MLTDQLIVKFRDGGNIEGLGAPSRLAALQTVASRRGVQLVYARAAALGAHVLKMSPALPLAQAEAMAREIAGTNREVLYAQPDRPVESQSLANERQADMYFLNTPNDLHLAEAWTKSTGAGVTVAVLDSGYFPHPDLAPNIVGGYDFITVPEKAEDGDGRDGDAQDVSDGHGTPVAGIIAAVGNNATGAMGVAYQAKIVPVRVLGRLGINAPSRASADIVDGMVWAAGGKVPGVPLNPHPARVINMSLGKVSYGVCDVGFVREAFDFVNSRGVVVVVAADNYNDNKAGEEPASCPGAITVAATGLSGGKASYSSFGSHVAVAAPAGDFGDGTAVATVTKQHFLGYQDGEMSGTSSAAPVVAGVAALMLSKRPDLTPSEVRALIQKSVSPFAAPCHGCGPGIVNAAAAVDAAIAFKRDGRDEPIKEWELANPRNISNDKIEFAQWVTGTRGKVTGALASDDDVDYYRVDVPAGQTLTAALGPSAAQQELRVYQVVENLMQGDILTKELVADTSSYDASKGAVTARRVVWSRVEGSYGHDGVDPLRTTQVFYVKVHGKSGATGPYELNLSVEKKAAINANGEIEEDDANNTLATAQVIGAPKATVNATMGAVGDRDFFKIVVPARKNVAFRMEPNRQPSFFDASQYELFLYDATGRELSSNVGGRNKERFMVWDNSAFQDLELYMEVRHVNGLTGPAGDYKLHTYQY